MSLSNSTNHTTPAPTPASPFPPPGPGDTECLHAIRDLTNSSNWADPDLSKQIKSDAWGNYAMGNHDQCLLAGGTFCVDIRLMNSTLAQTPLVGGDGCCLPGACRDLSVIYAQIIVHIFCSPLYEIALLEQITGIAGAVWEIPLPAINHTKYPNASWIPPEINITIPDLSGVLTDNTSRLASCGEYDAAAHYDAGAGFMMFLLIFLGTLVLIASLPGYIRQIYGEKKETKSAVGEKRDAGSCVEDKFSILSAWNFEKNWNAFVRHDSKRNTNFLNGIRFWSFMWVVLGHSALPLWNVFGWDNEAKVYEHYIPHALWMTVFVYQGFLAVDTFYWLAGFLVGYLMPKKLSKLRVKGTDAWWFSPLLIFRRWLRLMPTCIFVLCIYWKLWPLLAYGPEPLVSQLESSTQQCKTAWWKYSLQLMSLEKVETLMTYIGCMGHYWYMQSEAIMFYIAAFVMGVWAWNARAAKYLSGLIALIFIIVAWQQAYTLHIKYWLAFEKPLDDTDPTPANDQVYGPNFGEASIAYFRFWDRAHIYFVALTAGFIFRELDDAKHRITMIQSSVIQFVACVLLLVVNASLFDELSEFDNSIDHLMETKKYGKWGNASQAAYFALARPAWGIGLTLLSYSFMYKDTTTGFFQQMLSLPVYSPLAKLTFIGYLIHLPWMDLIKNVNETWSHFSPIELCVVFFGVACVSLLSAFVLHMIFEVPFATIEKWVFEPKSRPNADKGGKRKNSGYSVQHSQIGGAGLTENLLTSAEQPAHKHANDPEGVALAEGLEYSSSEPRKTNNHLVEYN